MANTESVVYFVRIGKRVKIGISQNLDRRLKEFATSTAEEITVMATMPGGRKEERRLHESLSETRHYRGEFFQLEYRLSQFIDLVKAGSVDRAWQWLEHSHPARVEKRKAEEHQRRVAMRRMKKAEFDAYCAKLVAERRQRLGW